ERRQGDVAGERTDRQQQAAEGDQERTVHCVFPSPLRGGVWGGGSPNGNRSGIPPSLALPHKGGGKEPSHMNRASVRTQHALVHHLAERRMREDRVHQVFLGGLKLHGNDETL